MKKLLNYLAYVANLFLVIVWVSVLLAGEWNWTIFGLSILGISTCIENIASRLKRDKDERN